MPLTARLASRVRPAALLVLLAAGAAPAASLFESDEPLDIELAGPFGTLIENRGERTELAFRLRVRGLAHDIEIRVRGKSRLRVCDFVPMRLDFPGDVPADSPFAGQDKLKLVTHCRSGSRSEADLLQEFLAYRVFNRITGTSFRVRLARVTYVDTGGDADDEPLTRYAFLIESVEELAARRGGQPASLAGVSLARLDDAHMARVYVFQYLIGNTDWSLVTPEGENDCCHNGKLVAIGDRLY